MMARRIEVVYKIPDTRAQVRKKKLQSLDLKGKINDVFLVDVFTIDKKLIQTNLQKIANILTNTVVQTATIDQPQSPKKFTWAIEIGFLPGVTDNSSNTVREMVEDLLEMKFLPEEDVYSSQVTFVNGDITRNEAQQIAESLANPLIQRIALKSYADFKKDKGMDVIIPKVRVKEKQPVTIVNLNVGDELLLKIGKQGIENHDGTRRGPLALDLFYLKTIQTYFKKIGRNPTDIELESIAQTWSEHCKHTIFNDPIDDIKEGLFRKYIKGATEKIIEEKRSRKRKNHCVSVFSDNSGAIEFDKKYLVTHKVETHNTPSALDPFGGSITGIVGVNRDAIGFGLGAKPVANFYGFCLADPKVDTPLYKGSGLTQKMLSSRRIMEGVIEGVNSGGNQSGIPTPQGFLYFDERYRGKPLVFVGTVGLIPKKLKNGKPSYIKRAKPKDLIVMAGGRVGKDGIHGATFSSEALDPGSPVTAVQIGDPITQKKLSDTLVKEARDLNLYHSITDNGAGGLSCSVAEMAKECGGCKVHLEKVPLKYPGITPWEIWVSESQERMTLAVPKDKWLKFFQLAKRRGVEATVIGEFTDSGKCVVTNAGKTIMDIDLRFLHEGLPKRILKTIYTKPVNRNPKLKKVNDLTKLLLKMLARQNIASFEFITQQYDYLVQGNLALSPLQGKGRINADASAIRPVLDSHKAVLMSQGLYPTYGDLDTYYMTAASLDSAIRNIIAAGGNLEQIYLLDNFCWCSPLDPFRLGQLKRAAKACYDFALAYKTPFISGKDSMFNDFNGFDKTGKAIKISIPPTLLITSLGIIDDVNKLVSLDAKQPGDLIYLLGDTFEELGGSEYFNMINEGEDAGGKLPKVNSQKNKKLYETFSKVIQKNLIASSISVGRGGLGVALAKIAMGGMLGVNVSLADIFGKITRDDYALFSESQGRIVVSINPKNKKIFEKMMQGNDFQEIGVVTNNDRIVIKGIDGSKILNLDINSLWKSYKKTFQDY